MVLERSDFKTTTWKRLSELLNERLFDLRKMNDQQHEPIKTATIRGQIAEVKRILALAEEASASEVEARSADPVSFPE